MKNIKKLFTPNQTVHPSTSASIYLVYIVLIGAFWTLNSGGYIPSPLELLIRIKNLFQNESLAGELVRSFKLSFISMIFTTFFSLLIAYSSTIPALSPLSFVFTKGRFLSLKGISIIFLLALPGGFLFKSFILAFSVSVFFITSAVSEILTIEKEKFTHARTLGMSNWRVFWEVVILGKMDRMFEIIRQNYAISWMMIATVESYFMGEGGVGSLLERKGKYIQNLPDVLAIQITILVLAIFQDSILKWFKQTLFSWSDLQTERK